METMKVASKVMGKWRVKEGRGRVGKLEGRVKRGGEKWG